MTKQEEIREGVQQTIKDDASGYIHLMEHDRNRISRLIVDYLHSQGVVIRHGEGEADLWIEPLIELKTEEEIEEFEYGS